METSQIQKQHLLAQKQLKQKCSPTLNKINLQQYQKPKTLIVVHYKGKRISVPLLGDCKNLTQMLYHHIDKFQQTVMKSQANWQKISNKKIVCFSSLSTATTSQHINPSKVKNNLNLNATNSNNNQHTQSQQGVGPLTPMIKAASIKKKIQQYLKYSDGDLKIDILLSFIRIENNDSNLSSELDITKYYKYMEIQPFYVEFPQETHKKCNNIQEYGHDHNNPNIRNKKSHNNNNHLQQQQQHEHLHIIPSNHSYSNSKYYFYRLLQTNRLKNVYLVRNIEDGYFYEVKVYRTGLQLAQREARFLNQLNKKIQFLAQTNNSNHNHNYRQNSNGRFQEQVEKDDNDYNDPVLSRCQIYTIPSQEQEDESSQDQQQQYDNFNPNFSQNNYKHLAIVSKYNPKGKLSQKLKPTAKVTQYDLLQYIKQLIKIVHTLHQKYNIIHRNITPQNIQIDELGNLKLVNFTSWVECYGENGQMIKYPQIDHDIYGEKSYNYQDENSPYKKKANSRLSQHSNSSQSREIIYEEEFQGNYGQWYDIGIYTAPQVRNKSKHGYNKLVDYYSVGIIVKQLYQHVHEFHSPQSIQPGNTKAKLMQKMISSLVSQNIQQRSQIVNDIIQGMTSISVVISAQQKQKRSLNINLNLNQTNKNTNFSNQGPLVNINMGMNSPQSTRSKSNKEEIQISSLNQIWLGKFISFGSSKCVQNQVCDTQFNGILHQEIIQYFKPLKKRLLKHNGNGETNYRDQESQQTQDRLNYKFNRSQFQPKRQTGLNGTKKNGQKKSRSRNKSNETKSNVSNSRDKGQGKNTKSNKNIQKNSNSNSYSISMASHNNNIQKPSKNLLHPTSKQRQRTKSKDTTKNSRQKNKQTSTSVSKKKKKSVQRNSYNQQKLTKMGYTLNNNQSKSSHINIPKQAKLNSQTSQIQVLSPNKGNKVSNKSKSKEKQKILITQHTSSNYNNINGSKIKTKAIINPMTNSAYAGINIPLPRK